MQRPDQQVTFGVCRRSGVVATCLLLLIALAVPAAAQDARGSIAGRVTDSSGAVLPGASVTVLNIDTNAGSNVHTNDNGQYTVLFLLPGTYSVAVELDGFRKSIHPKVQVRVGDKVQLDMILEPGGVTEEVSVSADRPILESGTATMGQVIDSKLISEIPLGDGTAYGLTRLVAGATFERRIRAAAADGQRQPARRDGVWLDQQRVLDRRHQQRRLCRRASRSSRRRTRFKNSRWKRPSTTRRSDTPAPAA